MRIRSALLAAAASAAAWSADAPDLATAPPAGLAVLAGQADLGVARRILAGGRHLVLVVAPDMATCDRWRGELCGLGLAHLAQVEVGDGAGLPVWNDQADLVVVGGDRPPAGADAAELHRVLAPGGQARVLRGGRWEAMTEPEDPRLGDWGHAFAHADRNPVSRDRAAVAPTGLRWMASLRANTGADPIRVDGAVVVTRAQIRSDADLSPMQTRLAHNGVPLWNSMRSGPRMESQGTGKEDPWIADGGSIFSTAFAEPGGKGDGRLRAHAIADGGMQRIYDAVPAKRFRTDDLVVDGGRIIATSGDALVCVDRATGALRWKRQLASGAWLWPASADGVVVALEVALVADGRGRGIPRGDSRYPGYPVEAMTAFAADSGEPLWRVPIAELRGEPRSRKVNQVFIHGGGVFLFCTAGQSGDGGAMMWAGRWDLRTGREVWRWMPEPTGKDSKGASVQPYFGVYKAAIVAGRLMLVGIAHIEMDPADGRILRHATPGNTICVGPGFSDGLIARGNGFFYDPADPDLAVRQSWMQRGPCASLTYVARGMVLVPPSNCSCYRMLYGFSALHGDPVPPPSPEAGRLEAFAPPPAERPARPDDWPIFLGDGRRRLSTDAVLPAKLAVAWSRTIQAVPDGETALLDDQRSGGSWNGPITAPVGADGSVFVCDTIQGRVVALDAASGAERWTHAIGVRLEAAPSWHRGMLYVGGQDGRVTALDAATGTRIWRYALARASRPMVLHGRLSSSWPILGGVFPDGDAVLATAGPHEDHAGGVIAALLDARTGAPRWRRTYGEAERIPAAWGSKAHNFASRTNINGGFAFAAGPELIGIPGAILARADGRPQELFYAKIPGSFAFRQPAPGDAAPTPAPWLVEHLGRQPNVLQPHNHSRGTGDAGPIRFIRDAQKSSLGSGKTIGALNSGLLAADDDAAVQVAQRMQLRTAKHALIRTDWSAPGKEVWKVELDQWPLAIAMAGDQVVVAGIAGTFDRERPWLPAPGVVARYRLADGGLIDRLDLPSAPNQNGIAIAGGRILIAGLDGRVHALAAPAP